ncbi:DNA methyltransferase, partial [Bacteroides fragilis]
LRCGNLAEFKYDWVWEKSKASNFLLAKKQPLKAHELISIFCNGRTPYYPIMEEGEPYENRTKRGSNWTGVNKVPNPTFRNENKGTRYPRSVKYFKTAESEGKTIHVNQKPVALLKYLIKTYTKEGDTVLDFASGSMSTAIACIHTNRKCICIEKDDMHFSRGEERIRNEYNIKRNVE